MNAGGSDSNASSRRNGRVVRQAMAVCLVLLDGAPSRARRDACYRGGRDADGGTLTGATRAAHWAACSSCARAERGRETVADRQAAPAPIQRAARTPQARRAR
ncbi:hypothetical protein BVIET440_80209 [Burkholderia vietnamiensis]|nr:hypothetical protein BVI1335_910017 [Burkholderia vietnamiensis]